MTDENIEAKFEEIYDRLKHIERLVKRIETIAESAQVKALMSHSLVVVRKISEENVESLNNLLDG